MKCWKNLREKGREGREYIVNSKEYRGSWWRVEKHGSRRFNKHEGLLTAYSVQLTACLPEMEEYKGLGYVFVFRLPLSIVSNDEECLSARISRVQGPGPRVQGPVDTHYYYSFKQMTETESGLKLI